MSSNITESVDNSDNEIDIVVESGKPSNESADNDNNEDSLVKNKEKKELADKIRKENESFMKSIEQTKIERLKFLLNQTEIFAHFLVGNKNSNEDIPANNSKVGKDKRKRTKNNAKKENINLLKSLKEMEGVDDLEMESPQITRLYYQPSILTGGKLNDYQVDGLNWLISLYETGLNGILADEMVW